MLCIVVSEFSVLLLYVFGLEIVLCEEFCAVVEVVVGIKQKIECEV